MNITDGLLQNDGNGLITPKEDSTDNIIPICYDKAANSLKTKDENGDVVEIGNGGGGGGSVTVLDAVVNKNVNKAASFVNQSIFSTMVNYGQGQASTIALEQIASEIVSESVINSTDPSSAIGVYADFVNLAGVTVRSIHITPQGIVGSTVLTWSWNGKPFQINVTTF